MKLIKIPTRNKQDGDIYINPDHIATVVDLSTSNDISNAVKITMSNGEDFYLDMDIIDFFTQLFGTCDAFKEDEKGEWRVLGDVLERWEKEHGAGVLCDDCVKVKVES